jgi:hypothetical protein
MSFSPEEKISGRNVRTLVLLPAERSTPGTNLGILAGATSLIRIVNHNIGCVSTGELRLIVATPALLIGHTVGDDGGAIRWKRIDH